MDTQEIAIVGGLLALAGLAAFMDWRRNNRDDLDRVRAALGGLQPDHRCVLTWYYLEEMTVAEIELTLTMQPRKAGSARFCAISHFATACARKKGPSQLIRSSRR